MGSQVLSDRSTRRIARSTGLDVVRAWSHGGYVMGFVTPEHRHGWWNKKSGEWGWEDDSDLVHYLSCYRLFEAEMGPLRTPTTPTPTNVARTSERAEHT